MKFETGPPQNDSKEVFNYVNARMRFDINVNVTRATKEVNVKVK